ncbi:MAG TPA: hypothetical protein VHL56_00675 [Candidatus Limnocylindrales bacterium]|jgi:uncharacterized membrane protein YeaQ/YmgE (transglycosylase-associated protein family)|nr:hypothetical protein [Candidatus Limnocylindrales bacterium]
MELAITLGLGGWLALLAGALLFGVIAQFIGEVRTGYEWLADFIAAAIGAVIASEFIISLRTYEPVWDGLAIVPAIVGGLALGVVVELGTRYLTGGRYTSHPMAV